MRLELMYLVTFLARRCNAQHSRLYVFLFKVFSLENKNCLLYAYSAVRLHAVRRTSPEDGPAYQQELSYR